MESKKEEVYKLIKSSKTPLTIRQIASKLNLSYPTAHKWVHMLWAEGKIKIKKVSGVFCEVNKGGDDK